MKDRFKDFIAGIDKLESVLQHLTAEQKGFKPSDDKWNINEVVAHLVDTEIQVYTRFRSILADDVPFLANHNEAKWAKAFSHAAKDTAESLSIFKLMRRLNYALIESLREDQLSMRGLHSVRGWLSIEDLIKGHIRHLENHIGQIKRNLDNMSQSI